MTTEKRHVGKMPLGTKSWQRPQPEYTLTGKSVMPIAALGGCILKFFTITNTHSYNQLLCWLTSDTHLHPSLIFNGVGGIEEHDI